MKQYLLAKPKTGKDEIYQPCLKYIQFIKSKAELAKNENA